MKNYILVILFFCANTCWGNAIDKIRSKDDVISFIGSHPELNASIDTYYLFRHTGSEPDSFFKIDIDKNGRTDLLIQGYEFLVVLDKGRNNYDLLEAMGGNFTLKQIDTSNADIRFKVEAKTWLENNRTRIYDTVLTYKFGYLTEYSAKPATHSIGKIEYTKEGGFGASNPLPGATVSPDGTITFYTAEFQNNNVFMMRSSRKLSATELSDLHDLINYIDLPALPNEYGAPVLDVGHTFLRVEHEGGTTEIIAHGGTGTAGLGALSTMLQDFFKVCQLKKIRLTKEEERAFFGMSVPQPSYDGKK
ncbi:hypothetical protein [Polluticoccus soli]|uniref:DUF6438 domain-containing protein n=1 Tax=Polluticoccus soli TaxID=3034150 RepID=UPI0023E2D336|nr:hypothetical protein [Flavipsychrobacter sp. JY13-12]